MSSELRNKIIRLAHKNPELRAKLLPLIKKASQDAQYLWIPIMGVSPQDINEKVKVAQRFLGSDFDVHAAHTVGDVQVVVVSAPGMEMEEWLSAIAPMTKGLFGALQKDFGKIDMQLFTTQNRDFGQALRSQKGKTAGKAMVFPPKVQAALEDLFFPAEQLQDRIIKLTTLVSMEQKKAEAAYKQNKTMDEWMESPEGTQISENLQNLEDLAKSMTVGRSGSIRASIDNLIEALEGYLH